jgi:predicted Zn finger-like uncharacterized protein
MVESSSVHIVCPHCTTSYAINPATLGAGGRNVRCSRCKEVWLARPEDALEPAMAETGPLHGDADLAAQWGATAQADDQMPRLDSPPIAGDWPDEAEGAPDDDPAAQAGEAKPRAGLLGRLTKRPAQAGMGGKSYISLQIACAALGALVIALLVWRADVVRQLPQTAAFYRMAGLDVNLRGLSFRDVKVTSETVEGKPVLVIEGAIVGETRKAVDLPRLRFSLRDAQGAEIYAWSSVLEQTVLRPGDRAVFKSRLASPPAEGRSVDIRFFNKRDIAGGSV